MLREGRLTRAQASALDAHWTRYGRAPADFAHGADAEFARAAPLYLEIGTGNGENLVAAAAASPARNHLGCEVHRPGLGHTLLALVERNLDNVRLVAVDVVDLLQHLPQRSLSGVWIYFPDPWPKKRHHKRRLVQAGFLDALAPRLRRDGVLRFASDDPGYAANILELLERSPAWLNLAGPLRLAPRPRGRVLTRFESRAVAAGRRIYEIAAALQR